MNTGNAPRPPKCALAKVMPETMDKAAVKRLAWQRDGHLIVTSDDMDRLDWFKREAAQQIGNLLYGERA